MLLYYSLATALPLLTLTTAQSASSAAAAPSRSGAVLPPDLVGTWCTKARSTVTGPDFYDPISDTLLEPDHTGISYSFTEDGFFEEAYYRAIPSPSNPDCPEGMMQWQHGIWYANATLSLFLEPIEVDGRQLLSSPCDGENAAYMRYNQSEVFKQYTVYTDPYHNVPRLDLFMWDGTPLQPMYLVYSPPQMLPTTTLNPTNSATATAGSGSKSKAKRALEAEVPLNWKAKLGKQQPPQMVHHINADRLWWIGLAMTGVGGLLYLGPRRMGIQI